MILEHDRYVVTFESWAPGATLLGSLSESLYSSSPEYEVNSLPVVEMAGLPGVCLDACAGGSDGASRTIQPDQQKCLHRCALHGIPAVVAVFDAVLLRREVPQVMVGIAPGHNFKAHFGQDLPSCASQGSTPLQNHTSYFGFHIRPSTLATLQNDSLVKVLMECRGPGLLSASRKALVVASSAFSAVGFRHTAAEGKVLLFQTLPRHSVVIECSPLWPYQNQQP